ncbi:MAG: phosphate acyltransferase PlsX [Chloroflexota bacterium]
MIIAVDAAGGDYAPHEIVKGAIKAAQEFNIGITLVGRKSPLHVLTNRYLKRLEITIVEANEVITYHESPMEAVQNKPNSSTVVGIKLVKSGQADAFISAGNSGAVLCASFLILGKIESVERPALCSIINLNPLAPALLIDAGANADCRPRHLLQFARLGAIYARRILDITTPRIGLMSNGEEETKGNRLTVEAHQLLKKSDLNFIGNIEGHDLGKGKADVIVADGFTGNVVIKTVEGLGESFVRMRQAGYGANNAASLQGSALVADVGVGTLVKGMDFREYGGACLLGVKGSVIIAHGRSHAKAIRNAIGLAIRTAESSVPKVISEELRAED